LSALAADRRTLVLAIAPTQDDSAVYLQVVSLDRWELGPQIKTGHYVDALAVSDDGLHIYAVMPEYNAGAATIWLQSYLYQPQHNGLQESWRTTLPFLPNSDGFTLSRDGSTLYAFSEITSPAQILQVHVGERGLEHLQFIGLPQLAGGADPPANSAPYKPGDPIPEVYHPAVIFSPDRTRLYLVYAPLDDPAHDRLMTIDLVNWTASSDQPISGASQALAGRSPTNASPFSSSTQGAPLARLAATATPFNKRTERGVISPDGASLYLTGESQTAQINPDGTWKEKTDYLGLWKITIQNALVAGRWFKGDTFYEVHMRMDGQMIYLFRQPSDSPQIIHTPTTLLGFSTQAQRITSSFALQFRERIIAAP
jgi:hypothetical protein